MANLIQQRFKKLQEKLGLGDHWIKNYPYEHIIISKDRLHPELAEHVGLIKLLRDSAKEQSLSVCYGLSPLIAAGIYTLTLDGLRGAVLQMIAHGFGVVGLFFAAEIITRRYSTTKISEMGGIRIQTPKFTSMFLILVLASVALPGTFNFIGEFELLYSLAQRNIWVAALAGTTIILGAFYMLRMFQKVMLGDKNEKIFADVNFNEGFTMVIIIAVLLFFGLYPKPIVDLITPSLEQILAVINRI